MEFRHVSVLLDETVDRLVTDSDGTYIDCTLGGAGHGLKICGALQAGGRYVGIDRDPAAIQTAQIKLNQVDCRVDLVRANFSEIKQVSQNLGLTDIHGILFDLGVSSHQLDTAERGFSYMNDGPLDMRMNPDDKISAFDVVNRYSEQSLAKLIAEYGEEKWAKRIAAFIAAARKERPVETTNQLVDIIKHAVPAAARREGPHPAKRTFQAIRIEVNGELAILRQALLDGVQLLRPGGRICVITFHSLEDRIVKRTFQELTKSCTCPPSFPICVCKTKPLLRLAGKAVSPSVQEVEDNPRARSATLRVAEKL
ncbi:ribosomal RNA small subunit methyltransferase H [Anaerosporomusa subterranea]|jgi:16S rRNA (cytosine1402-N4)-methyltransferase|uniref:Ribosomal RNA small subunit methyltransferase H n=1 Tax=Anaerosporomusa subterranea TaxID=1794912 RepID=A0A154BT68_ANASB|nr:16S rRNA (cytosine(1402)-N(4))-methyltransferase RsmH [Anaerosporomusa subterranea]KYZ77097.1 ribosomal RNA small subunit methyltransferase H [Anaerosporomusa subterranea]